MAGWKDKLRAASFRGVPFWVESAETEGGRRSATHEFPNKEIPYTEDLGRKAKNVQIEAFLIGPEYMDFRDGLITVLDKPGPGVLVHPYFGEMTLCVKTWRLKESTAEGGMATISIQFAETGELIYPAVSDNAIAKLLQAADKLEKTAAEKFAEQFSAGSGKALAAASNGLKKVAGIVDALLTPFAVLTTIADVLSRDLSRLSTLASTLARRPLSMLYRMQNALKRFLSLGNFGSDITRAYARAAKTMNNFFANEDTANTPSGRRIAANNAAMNTAFSALMLSAGAKAATKNIFLTEEDAIATRDALADGLLDLANSANDDALFMAAIDLRIAIYNAIPGDTANLAKVTTVAIPDSSTALPALVLAYKTYGDIAAAEDIIARNGIRNPAILDPGAYKVLSA